MPVLALQCREQGEAVPSRMLLHSGAKLEPVLPLSKVCPEKAAEAPALQNGGNPTASSLFHLSKQHTRSAQVVFAEPGRLSATLGVSQWEARLLLLTEFGTAHALSPC